MNPASPRPSAGAALLLAMLVSARHARAQTPQCNDGAEEACALACRADPDVSCSAETACVLPRELHPELERRADESLARGKREAAAAERTAGESQRRHLENAYSAFQRTREIYEDVCNPYVLLELGKIAHRLGRIDEGLQALAPLRCTVLGDIAAADEPSCVVEGAGAEIVSGRELWVELARERDRPPPAVVATPSATAASPVQVAPGREPVDALRGGQAPLELIASTSALLASGGGSASALMLAYLFASSWDVSAGVVGTPRFIGPRAWIEGTLGEEWFASARAGGTVLIPYRLAEGQQGSTSLGVHSGVRAGYGVRWRAFIDASAELFPSAEDELSLLVGAGVSVRLESGEASP